MPIYEYRCAECGFQEEYLQKVSEPQLTVCPSCNKPSFRKLLSAAGFQLKGSGWYATDFKNSGSKPAKAEAGKGGKGGKDGKDGKDAGAAVAAGGAATETKSEGKSESKVEAKSESKATTAAPTTASGSGG